MKVINHINNLHEKTMPPPLEPGQVVKYKLLIGNPNPDPEKAKRKPIIYPVIYQVPTRDRIKDPNSNKYVDIAIVDSFDEKGVITPKPLLVKSIEDGVISCTGGNLDDEEKYEFLELTNHNESNPHRDKTKDAIFKRIDDARDSKERSKKRSALKEALNYSMNLTNGEVKDFAASVGWNENDPVEVLRDKVEAFAQETPEAFIKVVESKDKDIKAIIKRAVDAGKIQYDTAQHRIVLNGQTFIKMDRIDGADWLTQVADYILHNAQGNKKLDTIKKLMAEA